MSHKLIFQKFAKIKITEILFIDKRQNLDFIFNLIFIEIVIDLICIETKLIFLLK